MCAAATNNEVVNTPHPWPTFRANLRDCYSPSLRVNEVMGTQYQVMMIFQRDMRPVCKTSNFWWYFLVCRGWLTFLKISYLFLQLSDIPPKLRPICAVKELIYLGLKVGSRSGPNFFESGMAFWPPCASAHAIKYLVQCFNASMRSIYLNDHHLNQSHQLLPVVNS